MRPLTQFDFHHTLAASAGPALVLFTAPGCSACRRLKASFAEARELFADLALFEVETGNEMGLAREFEVFHLPALFLFIDGEFHGEVRAEPLPGRLRAAIDALRALPAAEAP